MTQPAKVQEPSMEEILASIRRIIADDEAKPAEKPSAPASPTFADPNGTAPAKPSAVRDIPPARPKAAAQPPMPPAPAKEANSQDDIDAMLAGLDAATSDAEVRPPSADGDVLELTDEMILPDQ